MKEMRLLGGKRNKMTNETDEYFIREMKDDSTIEFYVRLKNMMRIHINGNSLEFKLGDFSLKGDIVKVDKDETKKGENTYFKYVLKDAKYLKGAN